MRLPACRGGVSGLGRLPAATPQLPACLSVHNRVMALSQIYHSVLRTAWEGTFSMTGDLQLHCSDGLHDPTGWLSRSATADAVQGRNSAAGPYMLSPAGRLCILYEHWISRVQTV